MAELVVCRNCQNLYDFDLQSALCGHEYRPKRHMTTLPPQRKLESLEKIRKLKPNFNFDSSGDDGLHFLD